MHCDSGACSGRGERDQQADGRIAGADYHMIEAAVMETARGRWFLVEYDRRRRAAETNQLLEAVIRLERALGTGREAALMVPAKQAALPRPASPPLPDASPIASGCRMPLGTCASVASTMRSALRSRNRPGWCGAWRSRDG